VLHRLADRDLAAKLAELTGTRVVPVSRLPVQQGVPGEQGIPANPAVPLGTMPAPVVPPDSLCELADDEFILVTGLVAVRAGAQPTVAVLPRCQAVTGRIPA
jgi:hypothetical protein